MNIMIRVGGTVAAVLLGGCAINFPVLVENDMGLVMRGSGRVSLSAGVFSVMMCFQSGSSFKDGAKNAPTTLTQITDAFEAMLQTYEGLWSAAQVDR